MERLDYDWHVMYYGLSYLLSLISVLGLAYFIFTFRPGHEVNTRRATIPFSAEEQTLMDKYHHESSFLHRPRGDKNQSYAKIFTRQWLPKASLDKTHQQPPKGIVLLIHGLNGHSGKKLKVTESLLELNFGVVAFDLEGFGRSTGRHGYYDHFHSLIDDTLALLQRIQTSFPAQKVFVFGESMGGLLALSTVLKTSQSTTRLVHGIIIQAPAISIHMASRPNPVAESIAKCLQRIVPKIPLVKRQRGVGNCPALAPEIEAMKVADPLFYSGNLRIGTGLNIVQAIEAIQGQFKAISIPYLLQHGTHDRVCDVSGSIDFHAQTSSTDKTFIQYNNVNHDMMNEPQSDQVKHDYQQWLLQRQS